MIVLRRRKISQCKKNNSTLRNMQFKWLWIKEKIHVFYKT